MSTVAILLPDFALIALGWVLYRAGRFGQEFWPGLEKLVYFVLFPALLFKVTAHAKIDLAAAPGFIATGVAAAFAAMVLGMAAQRLFRLSAPAFASAFQCAFRFNSYIGLAIVDRVYGEAGIAAFALMQAVMAPLVNAVAVWALARHGNFGLIRELTRNPLIIATVAGLTWNIAGFPLPEVAGHTLGLIAQAALPLGLIAVGAGLRLAGVRSAGSAIGYFTAVKLALQPAAALLLAHALGLSGVFFSVVVIFAALPASPSSYILATRMGGDGELVARILAAQILAAAVTLPLWLHVIGL
ncbi:MAG: AEC family transporter [Burkholderiales bacterium]|nr:AEC family transporter [Burkholderiales bacterium]